MLIITQAFLATWQEACQVECAIFQVPQYFTFVIRPINFVGPCATNIIFKVLLSLLILSKLITI